MKKALVIGIDDYPGEPLQGCVKDALAISQLLETNGDGSPNFSVVTRTSNDSNVTAEGLNDDVSDLFKGDADIALLYFAGHGVLKPETNEGYLASIDGKKGAWGVSLTDILTQANSAYPKIKSSVIILDCCYSGAMGEVAALKGNASVIGTGVTILTATHREGGAKDGSYHGLFTDIVLDGLQGGCADIRGNITPAALYSHVDQTLGAWEQRPNYKANVQTFITLREVAPKVPPEILRSLPKLFPDPAYVYPLDPSYEEDRSNVPESKGLPPPDPEHVRIFKQLQLCNRHGLVAPVQADHMYYAAIDSGGCKLTALGAHYRKLAELKRI